MNYFNDVHNKIAYRDKQVRPPVDMFKSTVARIVMKFDMKFTLLKPTLHLNLDFSQSVTLCGNSSVCTATRYGLEGPGIESH